MSVTITLTTNNPTETQNIGRVLGERSNPGDVFLLTGPLGAGKTCLTQGIAWGLGVKEHARSPTFVLATQYKGRLRVHHIDLFRIEDPYELEDLGLDDYLNDEDICIVEWADRAENLFSIQSLWVGLDYGINESDRTINIHTNGDRFDSLTLALSSLKAL